MSRYVDHVLHEDMGLVVSVTAGTVYCTEYTTACGITETVIEHSPSFIIYAGETRQLVVPMSMLGHRTVRCAYCRRYVVLQLLADTDL